MSYRTRKKMARCFLSPIFRVSTFSLWSWEDAKLNCALGLDMPGLGNVTLVVPSL